MANRAGLNSVEVVDSTLTELESLFNKDIVKNFEQETSLTLLPEYGKTKEEFFCSGFFFRTESENLEIIFTAKRVVRDEIGIEYGLRWCSCGAIENLDEFNPSDHIRFQNNRRWVLAKPYQEQLLALGKSLPGNYKIKGNEPEQLYAPEVIQHLIVEILADRIRNI